MSKRASYDSLTLNDTDGRSKITKKKKKELIVTKGKAESISRAEQVHFCEL